MDFYAEELATVALALFFVSQLAYAGSLGLHFFLRTLPRNFVTQQEIDAVDRNYVPFIVLFYPVLKELEGTMRTTFLSISDIDYRDRTASK